MKPDQTQSLGGANADVTASISTAEGAATGQHGVRSADGSGDRYSLGEEIARGGMGEVYRATDRVLGRDVALSVLPQFGPVWESAYHAIADAVPHSRLDVTQWISVDAE